MGNTTLGTTFYAMRRLLHKWDPPQITKEGRHTLNHSVSHQLIAVWVKIGNEQATQAILNLFWPHLAIHQRPMLYTNRLFGLLKHMNKMLQATLKLNIHWGATSRRTRQPNDKAWLPPSWQPHVRGARSSQHCLATTCFNRHYLGEKSHQRGATKKITSPWGRITSELPDRKWSPPICTWSATATVPKST